MENKIRTKVTVLIEEKLIRDIRALVYHTPGLTFQSFVEQSLRNHFDDRELEDRINEGKKLMQKLNEYKANKS